MEYLFTGFSFIVIEISLLSTFSSTGDSSRTAASTWSTDLMTPGSCITESQGLLKGDDADVGDGLFDADDDAKDEEEEDRGSGSGSGAACCLVTYSCRKRRVHS